MKAASFIAHLLFWQGFMAFLVLSLYAYATAREYELGRKVFNLLVWVFVVLAVVEVVVCLIGAIAVVAVKYFYLEPQWLSSSSSNSVLFYSGWL